ncbi:PspC domain-containing protein [Puteibacter caeruleilacunae]|nr:PspC domain-containing protein [Puteibacter caeruleilacunae]
MILGVTEWLSKRLNVSQNRIRTTFVVWFFIAGLGLAFYLICYMAKCYRNPTKDIDELYRK